MRWIFLLPLALVVSACGSSRGLQADVPPAFPFEPTFVESVAGERVRMVEVGPTGPAPPGGPDVVFMHGIPTSLYLWRNVLPTVAADARVVAFDLPGYGESDLPAGGDYGYGALAERTDAVLDRLADRSPAGRLVLVVNDLGSILGLDWAARNPDRVAGVALAEAVYMPTRAWHDQISGLQQATFWMFGSGAVGRQMTTRAGTLYRTFLRIGVERRLDDAAREVYLAPYAAGRGAGAADWAERRRVVYDGPGPATIMDGDWDAPVPDDPDHITGVMNRTAAALAAMDDVPFLLLYAEPGVIVNEGGLRYARDHFERLSVVRMRAGHFMPEDNPRKVADAVLGWYRRDVLGQRSDP